MTRWKRSLLKELEHLLASIRSATPLPHSSSATNAIWTSIRGVEMEALARSRSGAFASTSGRQGPLCPISTSLGAGRQSAAMLLQTRTLGSERHRPGVCITSELQPSNSWGSSSSRGIGASSSGRPPAASLATPTSMSTPLVGGSSLQGQRRGVTTYPPASYPPLPQLDNTSLSDVNGVDAQALLAGEGDEAMTSTSAAALGKVEGPVVLQNPL